METRLPPPFPPHSRVFRAFPLAALLLLAAAPAPAAETEMVGLAAVAIEPGVAGQLSLSPEQLAALQELIDARETKGMSLAMKSARLPKEERVAKLTEFRSESERQALALLTDDQATALRKIAATRDDEALAPAKPVEQTEPANDPNPAVADTPEDQPPSPTPNRPAPPASDAPPANDGLLAFNFKQQPWGEVIRWFADRADLSVVVDTPPPGTLTYRDTRRYTPAGALDVLNGVLLTKGYTLVRKDRMLLVINLEQDTIPPNIVTDVPLDELDERGEYELVRVLIELGAIDPTATADSLGRLVGPQGAIVVLPEAKMLQVTETAGRIRTMLRVVEAMHRAASPVANEELLVRSYPTGGADGAIILKVLYAVLADSPTAQMEVDADAGTLIARATTGEHAVIEQTLQRLRSDGRRVEVIAVDQVDPLLAASIVTRLFNPDAKGDKGRDPNAPVVEADRTTDSLLVRGTPAQVEQVRRLVEQLDTAEEEPLPGAGGPIRTLPIPAMELGQAWPQIEMLWPQLRGNPLRTAGPMRGIPSFRPGAEVEREQMLQESQAPEPPSPEAAPAAPEPAGAFETRDTPRDESRFRFASDREDAAPIFVSPGATTTVLASRDAEALDALESLLASVLGPASGGDRQFAVFYLKFADATTASTLLAAIFGGDSGGGGLVSDLAGAALGDGGDLLGGLLGGSDGGAGAFDSVSVDLVPDVRLNAIYARASAADLQTINQMLRVIDQPRGPDRVEATGVTRLIRVETDATEIAGVVRQVYQDRLQGSGGGRQPSPQDLIRALSGGGGPSTDDQEPERMTIGVDERSNSLVVRSSAPLFEEVRQLVEQLDQAGSDRPVSTRVLSLRNTSSDALRQTLTSLLGDKAVLDGTPAEGNAQPTQQGPGNQNRTAQPNQQQSSEQAARQQRREFRRQMQGLQQLQRAMQQFRQQQGGNNRGGRGGQQRGGQRPGR